MDKDQKRYICEKLKFREYHTGDEVIRQGEDGDEFFMIIKGNVSIFIDHKPARKKNSNNESLETSEDEDSDELTYE